MSDHEERPPASPAGPLPDAAPLPATPSTAACADACLTLGVLLRVGPPGLAPLTPSWTVAGSARPVRHLGSVDVFLEALDDIRSGAVLVIDDAGRRDRACVGDLVVLEAAAAGAAGLVVWGSHRDTAELLALGTPVFSLGAHPAGPDPAEAWEAERRAAPDSPVRLGPHVVTPADVVVGDADGVILIPGEDAGRVLQEARVIQRRERYQAALVREGRSLRIQLDFDGYRRRRRVDPGYTFRRHLRERGGAIER